jgi:hypothetical protein
VGRCNATESPVLRNHHLLLRHTLELAAEPVAVEPVGPEWTRSVRGGVCRFALLGGRAVKAVAVVGILLLDDGEIGV